MLTNFVTSPINVFTSIYSINALASTKTNMSLGRNMSTTLDTTSMCEYAAEWFMARILRQPLEHGQATDVCAKLFDLSDPQVWQAHMTGLVTVLVMVVAFVFYNVFFTGPGKIVNRVVFDLTPTAFFVLVAAVDSSSGDIVGEPLYKLELSLIHI